MQLFQEFLRKSTVSFFFFFFFPPKIFSPPNFAFQNPWSIHRSSRGWCPVTRQQTSAHWLNGTQPHIQHSPIDFATHIGWLLWVSEFSSSSVWSHNFQDSRLISLCPDNFSGHIENCTSLSQLDDWLQDFMPDPCTNSASISPTPVVQITSSDSDSWAASPAHTRNQSKSPPTEKIKINVEYWLTNPGHPTCKWH
jgi:hypothetical protein